ncbi:hypothetical protein [Paenibacillus sp. Marseille-Q4541]|uniref:hypothetical protein n=1 Tax=Paenibacillus sp. Marseille-Q4541 TaxID=2831522 RepID=UPI001BACECF2|nr:hypothetical protein [Paenibacillus sp. Marseille-Q4541]
MSRDWQKDMKICEEAKTNGLMDGLAFMLPDIGIHWLQQFAEWKAKAYELEVRNHEMLKVLERIKLEIDEFRNYIDIEVCENAEDQVRAFNEILKAERERADRAEHNEQKLKEAIGAAIRDGGKWENTYQSLIDLQEVIDFHYPKE